MAQNNAKWYTQGTTDKFDLASIFNTINPLSSLVGVGKGQDYVPFSLVKAFSGDDKWNFKDKNALKSAHIVSKIAMGGLAFGLGALGLRALMYSTDKASFAVNKSPATKIKKLYDRPTEAMLEDQQLKRKKLQQQMQQMQKQSSIGYQMSISALPLLAVIFAAGIGAKKADKTFDQLKTKQLEAQQDYLLRAKKQLAVDRIKKARGIKQQQQEEAPMQMFKNQSVSGVVLGSAGALGLVAFLLGRQAGKQLHDANNEDTIKFKAYKKGLQEYNKARSFQQNIDSQPLDTDMVALLNSNLDKSKAKKQSPVIEHESLKQILI